jgi:hypothetical protein
MISHHWLIKIWIAVWEMELLIAFLITLVFWEVPFYRRVNDFRTFERLCSFHTFRSSSPGGMQYVFFVRNVCHCVPKWHGLTSHGTWIFWNIAIEIPNIASNSEVCHRLCVWGRFSQKHNYEYMAKRWCLWAKENYMFPPVAAIIMFWQLSCYKSYILCWFNQLPNTTIW